MKKKYKVLLTLFVCSLFIGAMVVYAEPPEIPDGNGPGEGIPGMPSENSSTNISFSGATTIEADTTEENTTYNSINGNQNAILISGGTVALSDITVNKSGDASGDEADFYGTNAAILAYNSGNVTIKNSNITTNGMHANAVFAYGTGTININDSKIETMADNSGGIMVTGSGTLNAENLTVTTQGNSSAAIRSDRGGGNLTVNGGTYETNGTGSPAIYSTANIIVKNATLTATKSEGVVVEGSNSVSLEGVTLTDTNNTLNGNSETYKNIFLYQSMSGDAEEGNATFTAKDSQIITNQGDTIFVTNTTATINLENNTIKNNDGDFLRIQTGKWGNEGSNGGNVTLNMTNQKVTGNIIVDNISSLDMILKSKSSITGIINADNTAKNISLNLSSDSTLTLEGDSYLTSLTNEDSTNSNINLNGHKLFVNGSEITVSTAKKKSTKIDVDSDNLIYYIIAGSATILFIIITIVFLKKRKERY